MVLRSFLPNCADEVWHNSLEPYHSRLLEEELRFDGRLPSDKRKCTCQQEINVKSEKYLVAKDPKQKVSHEEEFDSARRALKSSLQASQGETVERYAVEC